MPGAFTPTCTDQHLPGFIKQSETLKSLGVERVCVITTNDRYVNSAWNGAIEECMRTKSGLLMLSTTPTPTPTPTLTPTLTLTLTLSESGLLMLSDADGDAVKAMGLVDDMGFGLGLRSKRFVVVAEGGVAKHANPSPNPNPNPDPNPDPNPGPNPDSNPDPNPDSDPDPNPNSDPDPNPNPNQVAKHVLVDEGSDSMQATSAEKVVQLLSPTPVAISSDEASPAALAGGALLIAAALHFATQSGSLPN